MSVEPADKAVEALSDTEAKADWMEGQLKGNTEYQTEITEQCR